MKTQITCLTALFLFSAVALSAQTGKNAHFNQVGISFGSLNSFGLQYKCGGPKTLFRFSALALNLGGDSYRTGEKDSIKVTNYNAGAGIRLGFERHVPLADKFDFIWGLEAGCNSIFEKTKRNNEYREDKYDYESAGWSVSPLIGAVVGVNYTIAGRIVLGAEIAPSVQYTFKHSKTENSTGTTETNTNAFGFGISTTSASLTVGYRFGK